MRTPSSNFEGQPSARLFLIQQHWLDMKDELTFDRHRVRRLAAALKLTVNELAAFIRVPIVRFNRYIAVDRFPATIALHLLLIERATFISSHQPPVFPSLD